jgi:uncharacterized protein
VNVHRWLKTGAAAGLAVLLMAASPGGVLEGLPFAKKLKLAKVGDDEAQYAVGYSYESGVDVKADRTEAAVWYRKAARQGHLDAMFRLARIVQEGSDGLKKSPETAFKLYEAAAKKDHAESQNWLGYCYQHGVGVTASPKDAVAWYRKAADAGLAVAQNNLGLMYLNGKGVERDFAAAFKLFERAALQDDGWGLNNLGGLYEMGWGVAKNKDKALEYYLRAKERGIDSAAENIKRISAAVEPAAVEKPIARDPQDSAGLPVALPEKTVIEPAVQPEQAAAESEPAPEKPAVEPEQAAVEPEPEKPAVALPEEPKPDAVQTDGSAAADPPADPPDPDIAEAPPTVKTDSSPD